MKRRSVLCALAALILLSWTVLSGCSRSKESVYLLNGYPELEESLLTLARRYEKEKGVRVRVVTVTRGGYENTLNTELNHFGPPALFTVNARTAMTWREHILDLSGTSAAKARTTTAFDLTDGEQLLALGWGDRCLGLAVNPGLLEKAGHSLAEITDYDSLRRVCQDIHARTDVLGFDAFASADLAGNAWRVTDVLFGPVYAREMADDPIHPAGTYLEHFRTIWELYLSNSPTVREKLTENGADPLQEFLRGKAVFLPSDSGEYGTLSAAVPDVAMIPVYSGLEGETGLLCHGGDAWAVNADLSAPEQKNALELLEWLLTDPEASAALTEHLGILPFAAGTESPNGFLRTAAEDVTAGRSGISAVVADRADPDRYRKNLTEALKLYSGDAAEENWAEVEKVLTDNK